MTSWLKLEEVRFPPPAGRTVLNDLRCEAPAIAVEGGVEASLEEALSGDSKALMFIMPSLIYGGRSWQIRRGG